MRQEAVVVIKLDAADLPAKAQQAGRALAQVGKAGEASARQTAAAMRQLPAQLTDVATQLAGGANPLLVLMQQGGQVKDSFGGMGAAIRGVGAAITPTAVAVGGLAAVLGLVGGAAASAYQEQADLSRALRLTGNAAGVTSDGMRALSHSTAEATGVTVGGAREIITELVRTGSVSGTVLPAVARAAAHFAQATGASAEDVAKSFGAMRFGVADWAAEHNKQLNFITAAEYRRIEELERMGRAEEAQLLVARKISEHLQSQTEQVSGLAGAWREAQRAFSSFWEAQKEMFRDTPATRLDAARRRLAQVRGAGSAPGWLEMWLYGTEAEAQAQIDQHNRDRLREAEAAMGSAAQAEVERQRIAAIRAQTQTREARGRPYIPAEFQVLDPRDAAVLAARRSAEENRILALLEDDEGQREARARAARERERRLEQDADFLQQLVDQNQRAGAALIEDERARGEALIAIERSIAQRRLTEMGMTGQARAEAERLLDERALAQRRSLEQELRRDDERAAREAGQQTYNEVRGALMDAFHSSGNPIQAFARALGAAVYARMSAALADSLATTMVGKDGNGGWLSLALGYVGDISGGGLAVDTGGIGIGAGSQYDLPTRGGMATGTNFVPREMVVKVHRGEAIVPAKYNPAAGGAGAPSVSVTINGPVPAEQVALVEASVARAMLRAQRRATMRG